MINTISTSRYPAEIHRSAYQRMLCTLGHQDLMIGPSDFWISEKDISDDGDLPLRLEAGRVEAHCTYLGWQIVSDSTIRRYLTITEQDQYHDKLQNE